MNSMLRTAFALAILLAAGVGTRDARAQPFALGTSFTYQGSLTDGASPANGAFDFEFALFDDLAAGSAVGSVQTKDDVAVTQGVFTVSLDFGAVFTGERRWLAISVRPGADTGAYTPLAPRVEISAAPHALFALDAADAANADALDGMDSTAFAVPTDIDWTNLANIPAGFLDGTDDDGDAHSLDAADGDPVDALFVDDFGLTGIGTTTPQAGLHVFSGPGVSSSPSPISETFNGAPYSLFSGPGAIALSGSVAYITSFISNSVTFADVSNPAAPSQLGVAADGTGGFDRLDGPRGVAVAGTTVYVTSQLDNALTILDASDPSAPILLGVAEDGVAGVDCLSGAFGVVVSGTTAYVASAVEDALCILDVSNPASPSQIGVARDGQNGFTDLNGALSVAISGTTAFVAAQTDNALTIMDISNPSSPQQLGVAKDGVPPFDRLTTARAVVVDGTTAYVSGHDDDAVSILDVSVPSAPALLGVARNTVGFTHLSGPAGLALSGTNLFVACATSNAVTVIDVSDPSSPVQLGVAVDGQGGFTGLSSPISVAMDSNGLLHTTGFQDNALVILDPGLVPLGLRVEGVAEIAGDLSSEGDLDVAGSVTAASFSGDGSALTNLPAGDWTTLANIPADFADDTDNVGADWNTNLANIPAGFADGTDDGGADWNSNLSNIPAGFSDGVDNLGDDWNALTNIPAGFDDDIDNVGADWTTNLTNIPAGFADGTDDVDDADASATNELQTLEQVLSQGNDANGGNALDLGSVAIGTGTASGKLTLADGDFVQTQTVPVHAAAIENGAALLSSPHALVVAGNLAYVTSINDDALVILDITDPAAPVQAGALVDDGTTLLNGALGLAVSGRHAYVGSNVDQGLEIVDVSNPASPTHVGSLGGQGSLEGLAVSGSYVFGVGANAFRVFDVSNPAAPTLVATLSDDASMAMGTPLCVVVSGRYAFVGSNQGVAILDVSAPTSPVHVASLFSSVVNRVGGAFDIAIQGKYAYVASSFAQGMSIVDISNPAAPVQTGAVEGEGFVAPRGICVAGRYAYVAEYSGSRVIAVDVSSPTTPTVLDSIENIDPAKLGSPRQIRLAGNHLLVTAQSGFAVEVLDLAGIDTQSARIGKVTATDLDAQSVRVRDGLHVGGGLNVSGGARIGQRLALGGGLVAPNLGAPAAGTALVLTAGGAIVPQTSSLRFKENVEPAALEAEAEKLLSLRPVHFDYKDSGERTLGLIAEDLHAMGLTDLVNYDQDGRPWSIAYEKLPLFQNELIKRLNERSKERDAALEALRVEKDAEIAELRRANAEASERLARIEAMLGAAPPAP